ncbi:MAG: hypothetical protein KH452_03300 [Clostridiales bacterium]|nr:hypothetical protein [Clostridiales bacterium]
MVKHRKKWNRIQTQLDQLAENMYLVMFLVLVVFTFLKTTTIPVPWASPGASIEYFNEYAENIPVYMEYSLIIVILFRMAIRMKERWRYLLLAAGLYGVVKYAVSVNQYDNLILLCLLTLGAKDIPFRKMMRIYTFTVALLLSITVGAAVSGRIENLAFGEGDKLAFGIVSSTDFAAHVFFLMLCYWYVRGERITWWEALLPLGAAVFVYKWSIARCSTICLIALAFLIAGHYWARKIKERREEKYRMSSVWTFFLSLSFVLSAIGTLVISAAYNAKIPLWVKLNEVMSNRLELGKRAIAICGFQIWGRDIRLIGNWAEGSATGKYFYIDSSYLQMAVMYGMIISALVLIAFQIIGYRAYSEKQWILLWILALMSIHGIIEQRIWSLSYCPFILALFARLDEERKEKGIGWKKEP